VRPGELLEGTYRQPVFSSFWASARTDSFMPPADGLRVRNYRAG
jgi:hypothetical protein